jgi:hypothetical protein
MSHFQTQDILNLIEEEGGYMDVPSRAESEDDEAIVDEREGNEMVRTTQGQR